MVQDIKASGENDDFVTASVENASVQAPYGAEPVTSSKQVQANLGKDVDASSDLSDIIDWSSVAGMSSKATQELPIIPVAPYKSTQSAGVVGGAEMIHSAQQARPVQMAQQPTGVPSPAGTVRQVQPAGVSRPAQQARPVQMAQQSTGVPRPAGTVRQVQPAGLSRPAQQARPIQTAQQSTGVPRPAGTVRQVQPAGVSRPAQQARPIQSAQTTGTIPPVQKQYASDSKVGAKQGVKSAILDGEKISHLKAPLDAITSNVPPSVAAKVASAQEAVKEMGLDDNFIEKFSVPEKFLTLKSVIVILLACFALGVVFGAFFFSSESEPASSQFTIGYIVQNPEIRTKLGRCGVVEQTKSCVLYIQNNQRRELEAKDFYALVEQLTGLKRFQIETANMRYAHKSIKPGYIAQFNVPALK